jgi:subfamily B ATP-binding cassette protein HlyB/CyaB
MLAGRVAQPILRLSQLWQDFQQVRISVDRLATSSTRRPSPSTTQPRSLPPIKGAITFDKVRFRYRPTRPKRCAGSTSRSRRARCSASSARRARASRRSTKLVQRLYVPEQGRVLVDGTDLALVDPAWLRRQVGVVLQENILFNRSVRENIALTNPTLPMER